MSRSWRLPIDAVLFDIGGTLVHEESPGTPVSAMVARPIGDPARDLCGLARTFRLGAVTNTAVMTEADVREKLTPLGVEVHLEALVTSIDIGVRKPAPDGIGAALARLGVEPWRALYIGDADTDADAAAAAGCAFERVVAGEPAVAAVRRWLGERVGPAAAAAATIAPADESAIAASDELQHRLTKPRGALGRLEALTGRLCGIAGTCPPPVPAPAAVAVFAGDHGVVAQGVTPWPQEVTGQMVANFAAGGAAINVLARQLGATVTVVDVGVAGDLDAITASDDVEVLARRVGSGTADLACGPAMTEEDARAALDVGTWVAGMLVDRGARCLVTGDMGIGNTTPAAALVAAFTGMPPAAVTGRGTGIDDAMLQRKIGIIERALTRLGDVAGHDPVRVLAEVGGFEHAALAGFILGAASLRVPVVVDGVIAGAALLAAHRLCPEVLPYAIAGHRSTEPGASACLEFLGLEPILDLGMRLGEGSGACLALPILRAAAAIPAEMATFDGAGVTDKDSSPGPPGHES